MRPNNLSLPPTESRSTGLNWAIRNPSPISNKNASNRLTWTRPWSTLSFTPHTGHTIPRDPLRDVPRLRHPPKLPHVNLGIALGTAGRVDQSHQLLRSRRASSRPAKTAVVINTSAAKLGCRVQY